MCEAPSTCRASTWAIVWRSRNWAYSGLMAAPGTPKAWVMPSFSITSTAAIAAFIFGMSVSGWVESLEPMLWTPYRFENATGGTLIRYSRYGISRITCRHGPLQRDRSLRAGDGARQPGGGRAARGHHPGDDGAAHRRAGEAPGHAADPPLHAPAGADRTWRELPRRMPRAAGAVGAGRGHRVGPETQCQRSPDRLGPGGLRAAARGAARGGVPEGQSCGEALIQPDRPRGRSGAGRLRPGPAHRRRDRPELRGHQAGHQPARGLRNAGLLSQARQTADAGRPENPQLPGLQLARGSATRLVFPGRRQDGDGARGRQPGLQRRRAAAPLGERRHGPGLAQHLGDPGAAAARRTGDRARRVRPARLRHPGRVPAAKAPARQGAVFHRAPEEDLRQTELLVEVT